jgi:hypothetical protein
MPRGRSRGLFYCSKILKSPPVNNENGYSSEQRGVGMFFQKKKPFENSRYATDALPDH